MPLSATVSNQLSHAPAIKPLDRPQDKGLLHNLAAE